MRIWRMTESNDNALLETGIAFLEISFGHPPCLDQYYENDITNSYPTFISTHKDELNLVIKGNQVILE
jgi:hypothetical protein